MGELQSIFTREYLEKLERMSFTMRQRMRVDGYSGERRSSAKGSSLEFSDFREYIPGDDLRRVDWNSYGRFEKLYVKLFLEEKQAEINIFLDHSRSMETERKLINAKALAVSLAYIALCGGDRVNFFLWNEDIATEKRGLRQKDELLELLDLLEKTEAKGRSRLKRAVMLSGNLRRGVAVVLSDLFTDESPEDAMNMLKEKGQEIIFVQTLSKEEESPKGAETVRFVDAETGEACDLELTTETLRGYEAALREHRAALAEACHHRGGSFCAVTDDMPLLEQIERILK